MAEDDLSSRAPRPGRVEPMPALDGVRACAVLAVIGYHSAVSWLGGGYYGVDAFFVLSGFLITSLLVAEWDGTGRISLASFWIRRARRLFPALLLMLSGVALVVGLFPGVLSSAHLVSDTLATIFYVANWHLAAEHASYFDAYQAQSPLLHTWTLAIEEQFYLIWPPIVLGVLGAWRLVGRRVPTGRTRRLHVLLAMAGLGALASAVEMICLAPTNGADPSRVYYGTDTRAQGLLIGAALAVACALWGPVRTRVGRRALGTVGAIGLVGVAVMWDLVPETSGLAFRGGFLLVSLGCAAVVAAAARVPASPAGRLLGLGPLRYLGRISYGMYLWYWPVLLVMTGSRVGLRGYPLLGVRLVVVISIASASYHLVETPVRRGALAGWRARVAAPGAAALVAGGMLLATTLGSVQLAAAGPAGSYLIDSAVPGGSAPVPAGSTVPGAASAPAGTSGAPPVEPSASSPRSAPVVAAAPAPDGAPSGPPASASSSPEAPAGTSVAAPSAPAGTSVAAPSVLPAATGPEAPVRILLVGDSMAGSLGVGLGEVAGQYGAQIVNEGMPGCSISMDGQIKVLFFQINPTPPCVVDDPNAIVADMKAWVQKYDPDVVVYLARSEVLTQDHAGQWQYLGEPAFDSWVLSRFNSMVPVLASGGAKVVLMTTPYYDTGEEADGDPWPEDAAARVTEDNSIISAAAGQSGATVLDLNGLVSPGGRFASLVDGVDLRCTDGAHFTPPGGRWLASRLLPTLVELGRTHAELPPSLTRTASLPPTVPSWYSKLPCLG